MWHKLREAVAKDGVEIIVEPTVQRWFSDEFKAANPQVLERCATMIRRTTLGATWASPPPSSALREEDHLHEIKAPTLYLSGAEDKLGGPPELMAGSRESARRPARLGAEGGAYRQHPEPGRLQPGLDEFLDEISLAFVLRLGLFLFAN